MKTSHDRTKLHHCAFEPLESRQMFAAGALDGLFSGDGKATLDFGFGVIIEARDVAVQADGKIVIAGEARPSTGVITHDFVVARLNFDGTPDRSFGPFGNGIVRTSIGEKSNANANCVAIQRDGKIIVAGGATEDGFFSDSFRMAVARYLPDGSPDKSFSSDGETLVGFDDSSVRGARDVAVQRDGKIVLVGTHQTIGFGGGDQNFAVARLNRDGSIDKSFGPGGKREIGFGSNDSAHAVAIDPNGNVVIAGVSGIGAPRKIAIARLDSKGKNDSTFGSKGTITTQFPGLTVSEANGVLVEPDGKIIIAGMAGGQFALARYLPNGQLDLSFGPNNFGLVRTNIPGGADVAHDITRSADGGLIVAGTSNGNFAVAAYTADGILKTNFGTGGHVVTDFGSANSVRMASGAGNRFTVVGGQLFKAVRYLDENANVVSLEAFSQNANEDGSRFASINVKRSEALPVPTRVFLNFSGSATNGSDYTTPLSPVFQLNPNLPTGPSVVIASAALAPGQASASAQVSAPRRASTPRLVFGPGQAYIDIPAGAKSVNVKITASQDAQFEPTETATFTIAPDAGYELRGNANATVNIADDDALRVNFQPAGAPPPGYVADIGQVFGDRGNGFNYGWDADNTANTRVRNNPGSPDVRFDTLNHMQKDGANRKWEVALPNGMYEVTMVAGDPNGTDAVFKMNLENSFVISGTPSGDVRWFQRTVNVQVSDGRLTLSNAAGAVNNKIAFMDIKAAAVGAAQGPVTANEPISLGAPQPIKPATRVSSRIFSQVLIDLTSSRT